MRRIRLIIAYDGTDYVGWQYQKNGTSIQEMVEKALQEITGNVISLQGSGRTDSGVHARAQVAHFDTEAKMPADKFSYALNTRLPHDIRVVYSEQAPNDFHARFSAKEKEYRYKILLSPHEDVFSSRYTLHVHAPVDIEKMISKANLLVGTHDLAAFKSSGTTVESTVRTIYRSEWVVHNNRLEYQIVGNGFLYNTVRIIVGTFLSIGTGSIPENSIEKALMSCRREDAGQTAPAHGLTLWRVKYSDFDTEEHIPYDG